MKPISRIKHKDNQQYFATCLKVNYEPSKKYQSKYSLTQILQKHIPYNNQVLESSLQKFFVGKASAVQQQT